MPERFYAVAEVLAWLRDDPTEARLCQLVAPEDYETLLVPIWDRQTAELAGATCAVTCSDGLLLLFVSAITPDVERYDLARSWFLPAPPAMWAAWLQAYRTVLEPLEQFLCVDAGPAAQAVTVPPT